MSVRHLPKRTALLDAGCGNGEFALRMARIGWQAHGLEPDPVAAEIARAAGVPVVNTPLEDAELPPRHFDAITMSHVIEHLHDPAAALQKCRRSLRPDGLLWIATPNLDSLGHRSFRSDWLHLDPPRHLILFDRQALERLLVQSGFGPLTWFSGRSAEFSFANSAALARDVRPFTESELPTRLRLRARAADALALVRRQVGEELVVLARRA
jgi:SAM-dependent methyltransferase